VRDLFGAPTHRQNAVADFIVLRREEGSRSRSHAKALALTDFAPKHRSSRRVHVIFRSEALKASSVTFLKRVLLVRTQSRCKEGK
jgi:hypothetical protein